MECCDPHSHAAPLKEPQTKAQPLAHGTLSEANEMTKLSGLCQDIATSQIIKSWHPSCGTSLKIPSAIWWCNASIRRESPVDSFQELLVAGFHCSKKTLNEKSHERRELDILNSEHAPRNALSWRGIQPIASATHSIISPMPVESEEPKAAWKEKPTIQHDNVDHATSRRAHLDPPRTLSLAQTVAELQRCRVLLCSGVMLRCLAICHTSHVFTWCNGNTVTFDGLE